METVLAAAGVVVGVVLWLMAAYRVGRDDRLSSDARRVASFSILVSPWVAVAYWLSVLSGSEPLWAHGFGTEQDEPASDRTAPSDEK